MNRILSIAAIVALVTTLSFAQEGGPKFGIRAGFSFYDASSGEKELDKYVDMGYGFGGGLVKNIPITSSLSFAPEVSLLYRKIYNFDAKPLADYEAWETEFAVSIPVMFQFTPVEDVPFYLAAGVQLDIPIAPELTNKVSGVEVIEDWSSRASIDFGIPLGLGYFITPNLGIDFRAVFVITNPGNLYLAWQYLLDDVSYNKYGVGVTYFF